MPENKHSTTHNAPIDNANNHFPTFSLFKRRRFVPYFFTVFFGSFNDNFYKQALVYILTFKLLTLAQGVNMDIFNNLAAGVFIIPYVFFSALAGQIADKYEKSSLIRVVKIGEIGIMLLAAAGFYFQSLLMLMVALVLMGTQSSFFSPIKYSILPQHLEKEALTSGNGLIEMGNFTAIIIGTIVAGLVIKLPFAIDTVVTVFVLALAACGFIASRFIPTAPAAAPNLRLDFNIIRQTFHILKLTWQDRSIFYSVIGISWFWFVGAVMLSQMPRIVTSYLQSGPDVLNAFLAAFSIGIGIGAVLTAKISRNRAELGLVTFGALGLLVVLSYVVYALSGITPNYAEIATDQLLSLSQFMQSANSVSLLVCYFLLGMFGGMFEVPLVTYLQEKSPNDTLARLFAANNVCNAIAMVFSAVLAIVVLSVFKLSMPVLLAIVAVGHIVMLCLLLGRVSLFKDRFLAWVKRR